MLSRAAFIALLTFVIGISVAYANNLAQQEQSDEFHIYLVRHAEKNADKDDPNLTECGQKRAQHIAQLLNEQAIRNIFSTPYNRTQQTAAPLAAELELDVTVYSPLELELFADKLLTIKGNTLVVGHSNTTPVLAGLLVDDDLQPFAETIYDRLYKVDVKKGKASLQILQQGFSCDQ
ncbi:histidine phosphatase family protein [Thalassotalea sp. HSM 43]|uniref:SixA phosphatase family protein n=1 Tax=Thalassotalea sp. HSM 43 TaxID=2552945 RepID=UPI00108046E4|nr:phosphoglycerate mutase family protein [Thalassotalea sp. HSM 43]QBY03961.1 histidine phosphatase family protein [Thalassotalea sp. HSM 43]